jgi:hypothetical protein
MVVFGGVETAFASMLYSFTTIDVPGDTDTEARGINDSGQMVGSFQNVSGSPLHGFVYREIRKRLVWQLCLNRPASEKQIPIMS